MSNRKMNNKQAYKKSQHNFIKARLGRIFQKRTTKVIAFALVIGVIGTITTLLTRAAEPMPTAPISRMMLNYGEYSNNQLGDTSRYKYVLLNEYMSSLIPRIKAANPNTKVLVYKNGAASNSECQYDSHPAAGVSYCETLRTNPEWFLKNSSGQPFTFCDYNYLYWMDIGNPGYQQKWIDNVSASIKSKGFDGVFMDDLNIMPGHCMDGRLPKYTDQQYGEAFVAFTKNTKAQLQANGIIFSGNVAGNPWNASQRSLGLQVAANIDIYFREFFHHWNETSTGNFMNQEWLYLQNYMTEVGQLTNVIANTYDSSPNTANMLYGRASFLQIWNGKPDSAFQYMTYGNDPYNAVWATDIGVPTNSRYQVGGAHKRDFTGGTAIVNPSSTTSATVDLGATYKKLDGTSVTSVTLTPGTAIILRSANTEPAPTPAPAPAPAPAPTPADVIPPTQPAGLNATTISSNQINLAWTSSTDNAGVRGYDVYRNQVKITTVTTNSFNDAALSPSTSYAYRVIARDAAGNSSPESAVATSVTQAVPIIPTQGPIPVVQSNAKVTGQNGLCMDAYNNGTSNGTQMIVWTCHDKPNQRFDYTSTKQLKIRSATNKCVDVNGGSTANEAKVQLWDCNGSVAQQWTYLSATNEFKGPGGKCLDMKLATNLIGTKMQLFQCSGGANQKWQFVTDTTTQSNTKLVGLNGMCLDANANGTFNGTQMIIWTCSGNPNQRFDYTAAKELRVRNTTNKCVDVNNGSTANGTRIQLWDCVGNVAQKWSYYATTGELRGPGNKCMDVTGSNTTPGTKVQLYDCNGTNAQKWRFVQ